MPAFSRRVIRITLFLAVAAAVLLAVRALPMAEWLELLKEWVRGIGAAGFVLYVIVYAICCVLLIPAVALTLGAGAIFGFVAGTIVVTIGATLGATAAFLLARSVMRHRVERMAADSARFRELDRAIATEGTKIMWLVRLSGFPPFILVNYALGLTGVTLRSYLLTTAIGILPGVFAFTWAGSAGAEALTGSANRTFLIITAVGAVLVSAYIARVAMKAIKRAGVG
ncbi:MAG TPA: TVP38/TMEM64 family protein [Thermoanaerobaculia bacterium]